MAVLTRDADANEEITKVDDVFDTFFTKTEVNAELNKKADKVDTYTKTEVDTRVNAKVNKSGDTMTGRLTGNGNNSNNWIRTLTNATAFYVPPLGFDSSGAQGVLSWRTANGDGYAISNLNNGARSTIICGSKANIDNDINSVYEVCWFEGGRMYVPTPAL
jgi:hypothetical protein